MPAAKGSGRMHSALLCSASMTFNILWLLYNLGYTTLKVDQAKEGGFQRKSRTYYKLNDFKHLEGFWKSFVENHELQKILFYNRREGGSPSCKILTFVSQTNGTNLTIQMQYLSLEFFFI
jgi:hypothetical protein